MRGGVSNDTRNQLSLRVFSPRAWRCFHICDASAVGFAVFSTCVEVFLSRLSGLRRRQGFLHVRGGVSRLNWRVVRVFEFSPRAWRCFSSWGVGGFWRGVFSTCVEVFLRKMSGQSVGMSFLHVRGGVSGVLSVGLAEIPFSPRAWRCFSTLSTAVSSGSVFSTCVEVFLSRLSGLRRRQGFLHVRGGVSINARPVFINRQFSPRAWRCFSFSLKKSSREIVFSTCVEVFL